MNERVIKRLNEMTKTLGGRVNEEWWGELVEITKRYMDDVCLKAIDDIIESEEFNPKPCKLKAYCEKHKPFTRKREKRVEEFEEPRTAEMRLFLYRLRDAGIETLRRWELTKKIYPANVEDGEDLYGITEKEMKIIREIQAKFLMGE